jgi:hypothetical protein
MVPKKPVVLRFEAFSFIFWQWHEMIVRIKLTANVTNHHKHTEQ